MSRSSLMLAVLFAISFTGFLGYSYLTHPVTTVAVNGPIPQMTPPPRHDRVASTPIVVAHDEASASATISPETVAKWIAESSDADPKIRAAAIAALANAPRAQAILALQKVLSVGEPADRPLALRSLRTLALQQGDMDGGIRDIFRQAIYDGRDEVLIPVAQAVLDDVESHLDGRVGLT